ncbi:MAG: DUF983 domain-containing protein [Ktedonobacterales bacterium]
MNTWKELKHSLGLRIPIPLLLLWRGVCLRCPRCGKGKLFRHWYTLTMEHRCSNCGWVFEREEGYWTGAMAINLIVTELLIAAGAIPLAIMQAPILPLLLIGIPATILFPILFYRYSKSLWMTVDFIIHPTSLL